MNNTKYQELLNKTAALDPAAMLLYKVAAASRVAAKAARQPAVKKTVGNILTNVLNKGVQGIANSGERLSKDIGTIAAKGKWVSDSSMFPAVSEAPNKMRMLKALLSVLKNPLTLGFGAGIGLNAGAVGYGAYKGAQSLKGSKAADKAE